MEMDARLNVRPDRRPYTRLYARLYRKNEVGKDERKDRKKSGRENEWIKRSKGVSYGGNNHNEYGESNREQLSYSENIDGGSGFLTIKFADGPPNVLHFERNEIEKRLNLLEDDAIICKIKGKRPSREELQEYAEESWDCEVELIILPCNFFFVRFAKKEDKEKVLAYGWFYGQRGIYMKRWTNDFNPFTERIDGFPVWVNLYALPLEFCTIRALTKIGNSIGIFLYLDDYTKKNVSRRCQLSKARFAVWMYATVPKQQNIILSSIWRTWNQKINYENVKLRCYGCQQYGHKKSTCRKWKRKAHPILEEMKEIESSEEFKSEADLMDTSMDSSTNYQTVMWMNNLWKTIQNQ